VDGNDFLAVHAVTSWAAERARANLGATVIELYTYRAEGHSTSDDPSKYRPASEPREWPFGDPIERLRHHLTATGELSDTLFQAMTAEVAEEVRQATKQAESIGKGGLDPALMFDDVFAEPDWRLQRQARELEQQGASRGDEIAAGHPAQTNPS
jgi:2-oxoisovalerate dehydrogenase E1 component alpha subunit